MAGVKGLSGRHPKPSTMVNRALAKATNALPEIMQALIVRAKGEAKCPNCGTLVLGIQGDKDAAFYLADKVMGRTPIAVDQRFTGIILGVTADERRIAIMEAHEAMQRVLELPTGAIEGEVLHDRQSVTAGSGTGEGKALQGKA